MVVSGVCGLGVGQNWQSLNKLLWDIYIKILAASLIQLSNNLWDLI